MLLATIHQCHQSYNTHQLSQRGLVGLGIYIKVGMWEGGVKVRMVCVRGVDEGECLSDGGGWRERLFDSLLFSDHDFNQERGYLLLLATVLWCR